MNKFARNLVASCVALNILLFNTASVTHGLTVKAAYNYAYNTTMKALEDKTQKSIYEARNALKKLEGTTAEWTIGELSSKLDTVQHPLLVNIINSINFAKQNPNQTNINVARSNLDTYLPSEWSSTFSSAIDLVQQQLMNEATDLYQKAELTKTQSSIQVALAKVLEIKQATNSNVVSWACNLEYNLNKLLKESSITVYTDVEPQPNVEAKVTNQELLKAKYSYIDYLTKLPKEDKKGYYSAVFKDLDFDGIPEMIIGKTDPVLSPMKYAFTFKKDTVKPLIFIGDDGCRGYQKEFNYVGFNAFTQGKLCKFENSEKLVYVVKDTLSNYDAEIFFKETYEMSLKDDVLTIKAISKYGDDNRRANRYSYEYMRNKVSEQEYNDALTKYDSSYKEIDEIQNLAGVNLEDNDSINRLLNEGFKGFLYINQPSQPNKDEIKFSTTDAENKTKNAFKEYSLKEYGTYDDNISYKSYGFLKPGYRIDGKPSQEYYFIRGTLNGDFIKGSFYVHCGTGKVYVRFGEHEVINIPNGNIIGFYRYN